MSKLSIEETWLWKRAFLEPRKDAPAEEQLFFSQQLLAMRERVKHLVDQIPKDMPGMTVHDLTHLDALWTTASTVAEGALELNPAEAFVFGASVLLHDSAMTVAAYPNGLDDLKITTTWRDAAAQFAEVQSEHGNTRVDVNALTDSEIEVILPNVLRRLHAPQAEKLATQSWKNAKGDQEYLIADSDVRSFYGPLIGKIAHSHWWDAHKVAETFANDLGAFPPKTHCLVDKVKVACLLRVADALHMDQLRAPQFLRTLTKPSGISALHWTFQEKLARPHISGEAVVYTTGSPFDRNEAEAWWLAHDLLAMVDRELSSVDLILQARGRDRLRARRVEGVGSPEALARTVETSGWRPVDARIRASDVPRIVEILGGEKLYGDDLHVPLRELIQNSADAVQARRRLQNRPASWGKISVSIQSRSDGVWLVVEDNGVGMSEVVLTGPLLDFGTSFWRSSLAAEEFPGLAAAGMRATGRFGIGFFSIFMLGSTVRVTSKRFDKGIDASRVIEISGGPAGRPIIWPAEGHEVPIDGGTRVEVLLDHDPKLRGGLLWLSSDYSDRPHTLERILQSLAPNIDVQIEIETESGIQAIVIPGDWLTIPETHLWARLRPSRDVTKPYHFLSNVRPIQNADGRVFGRATIIPSRYLSTGGVVTVSGLRATTLYGIEGVLSGSPLTVSRDVAVPSVPLDVLAGWATDQAKLIYRMKIDDADKAHAAEVVMECGGEIGKLPVVRINDEWLTRSQLRTLLKGRTEIKLFAEGDVHYDEEEDEVHPREFRDKFQEAQDVVFVPKRDGRVLRSSSISWPKSETRSSHSHLYRTFESELLHVWKDWDVHDVIDVVGSVDGTDIYRELRQYKKVGGS